MKNRKEREREKKKRREAHIWYWESGWRSGQVTAYKGRRFNRCCGKKQRWQTGREMNVWCQIPPLASVRCQWGEDNQKRAEQWRENTGGKKGKEGKGGKKKDSWPELQDCNTAVFNKKAQQHWSEWGEFLQTSCTAKRLVGSLCCSDWGLPVLSSYWVTGEKFNYRCPSLDAFLLIRKKLGAFFPLFPPFWFLFHKIHLPLLQLCASGS